MTEQYQAACPKCHAPVAEVERVYHALGERCDKNMSGSQHIHWTCRCGYIWHTYPR